MTNEDIITMFKMMSAENFVDHEIVTDEDFLHIVEKWTGIIQDTGLCGGLEHFTLIECKKALEKQIPKKPVNKWEADGIKHSSSESVCPNCHHTIECEKIRINGKAATLHCKYCGQAIDWSETK